MANPTAEEQELLELINRMRTAPAAELAILLNSSDPNIQAALTQFGVKIDTLQAQWKNLKAAAPLAWSSELNNSAAGHNGKMIQYDRQEHQVIKYDSSGKLVYKEKDLAGRLEDAGYQRGGFGAGENIYAYGTSIIQTHASFVIDWGKTTADVIAVDGIQDPAAHRDTILNQDFREVGISVTKENNSATEVGALVVTQDFGNRAALNGKAWLLGVAFQDTNKDGWYTAGEGLKNVQVKITGIDNKFSETMSVADAGGYQKLLDIGRYQVDFIQSNNVVGRRVTAIDSTEPSNIKLDLVLPVIPLGNLQNAVTANKTLDFRTDSSQSTPNLTGKKVDVSFINVSADAAYHNYGGLYRVEDSIGTVVDPVNGTTYRPGDAGYIAAALRRSLTENNSKVQLDNHKTTSSTAFKLDGGYQYGTFVVANGSIEQVLTATDAAKAPHVYFNYAAANADGKEHFMMVGNNTFAVEDTFNLTDNDYNDLIFQVNAKVA